MKFKTVLNIPIVKGHLKSFTNLSAFICMKRYFFWQCLLKTDQRYGELSSVLKPSKIVLFPIQFISLKA